MKFALYFFLLSSLVIKMQGSDEEGFGVGSKEKHGKGSPLEYSAFDSRGTGSKGYGHSALSRKTKSDSESGSDSGSDSNYEFGVDVDGTASLASTRGPRVVKVLPVSSALVSKKPSRRRARPDVVRVGQGDVAQLQQMAAFGALMKGVLDNGSNNDKEVETLKAKVDRRNARIAALKFELGKLIHQADRVPGLESELATTKDQAARVPGLESELAAVRHQAARVPGLETKLEETETELKAAEARVDKGGRVLIAGAAAVVGTGLGLALAKNGDRIVEKAAGKCTVM